MCFSALKDELGFLLSCSGIASYWLHTAAQGVEGKEGEGLIYWYQNKQRQDMLGLVELPVRVVSEAITTWPVEGMQDLSLTPELLRRFQILRSSMMHVAKI